MKSVSKLKFNPIVLLDDTETARVRHLEIWIQERAKAHLGNRVGNFNQFIEIYHIIQTFKNMDTRYLENAYTAERGKLEDQDRKIY